MGITDIANYTKGYYDAEQRATFTLLNILATIVMLDNATIRHHLEELECTSNQTSLDVLGEIAQLIQGTGDVHVNGTYEFEEHVHELMAQSEIYKVLEKMVKTYSFNFLIGIKDFVKEEDRVITSCIRVIEEIRQLLGVWKFDGRQ